MADGVGVAIIPCSSGKLRLAVMLSLIALDFWCLFNGNYTSLKAAANYPMK